MTAEDEARAYYAPEIARGVDRFFEPRRTECVWCGSSDLAVRAVTPDIVQHKPGVFTLDGCRACGHVFQNPRLTGEGLGFYYRDTYDGLGEASTEFGFGLVARDYRRRARTLRAHGAQPKRWLDVGAGFGHFCKEAKGVWPDTEFAGLDQGAGIVKGLDRGWVAQAHRGSFVDLAPELAGSYDVVSMHHYLEHTTEPFAEIEAAARVLDPGGFLQIEVPDPESAFARLFGNHWFQWMQPQHLHMFPHANLAKAVTDAGFEVVEVVRSKADLGHDFVFASLVVLNAFGPKPSRPWAKPTLVGRLRHYAALLTAVPTVAVAFVLDHTVRHLIPGHTNAYRLIARRV
ncbi:class I SAM-dependent methyltransferase [Actinocorallia sp. A-T 12471]|uniref:class I SAM-dependent methyltransferase n=1 Tax=Actinocorallia sp. A-T 12471 TaxID=3089813 RepID=UPI0029CFDFCB|nr:class I SAM-dependent methyltransferase [Actinocorallia sp. A-T 12471]MDX6739589.1 class I SAM-dependent methyltransferase [Actinocorallia sp. A-T 12471]